MNFVVIAEILGSLAFSVSAVMMLPMVVAIYYGEANAAIARLESVQKTEMFFAQSKLPVCVIERLKETL